MFFKEFKKERQSVWSFLKKFRLWVTRGKQRFVESLLTPFRVQPKKQATVRFETPPGKQAQMDWVEVGISEVNGKLQKLYASS